MSDPLQRLLELRALPARRVIGLMSGTSADGINAALVEISGHSETTRVRTLAFQLYKFPPMLAARIFAAGDASAAELCDLDFALGHAFGDAASALMAQAGASAGDVHLVGSHGQTGYHRPPRGGRGDGSTLQIGEPACIAERTGLPVIADFRVRDVAAGGQGAPLVPMADYLLGRAPGKVRALQHIGGIANVTVVPDAVDGVYAFDTGPGNMVLDAVAVAASGGREHYDADGARAARGRVDTALLAELMAHPFFAEAPPRSTGREAFGKELVSPLLARLGAGASDAAWDDLLATVTRFTAEAIAQSYREHVLPRAGRIDEVLVSGGGVHNGTLMRTLAELLAPIPVSSVASQGGDPDAKEAVAFAVLANQTLFGEPGNLPAATGARGPRVLGKITL